MAKNHNIEDFFKKRLESHEFPFQEEDWLSLESRLAAATPTSGGMFFTHSVAKTVIIATVALTSAFILGWLARDLFIGNPSGHMPPARPEQYVPGILTPEKQINREIMTHRSGKTFQSMREVTDDERGTLAFTAESSETQHNPLDIKESESHTADLKILAPIAVQWQDTGLSPEIIEVSPEQTVGYGQHSSPAKIPFRDRWSLGIIIAPDYNTVSPLHSGQITAAFGGRLSYNISPAWSVSAGLLYNNKKYDGNGEYYEPPEGYWLRRTNGIVPDNISGSCRVLDIPVLATYRFLKRDLVSMKASAGISNYFLLDEKYDFYFTQYNPGAAADWKTEDNTGAAFSVINLAVGLEVRTSRKIALAIEPYMKIPVRQIGWAKVNMYSMGLYITFNYRLSI